MKTTEPTYSLNTIIQKEPDNYGTERAFFTTKSQEFINHFDFEDRIQSEPVNIYTRFAARNSGTSVLQLEINDQKFSQTINGVSIQSPEATYARNGVIEESFIVNETINSVKVSTNAYQGWLDKIEITVRKKLDYNGSPIQFSDRNCIDHSTAGFNIDANENDLAIWEITKPTEVQAFDFVQAPQGKISFYYETANQLKRFIIFEPTKINSYPGKASRIQNQNLHGIFEADMIIVYHEDFASQSEELANHRRDFNGFKVETISTSKIFNEFSSGRMDPTAIRDFAKMIYDRYPSFNFLLLMGDGSYDYRAILNEQVNDNYVPVYETEESLNPISGYVSDDYFALLSDSEGLDLNGNLDIAVGRLPVRNAAQGRAPCRKDHPV
jgi:hypothetical protein